MFEEVVFTAPAIKLIVRGAKNQEVARAFVYILRNDLHEEPLAVLEDVFVAEDVRGEGIGSQLIAQALEIAKTHGCYKIVATSRNSRPRVHSLYESLGFERHGVSFRMNL